MKASSSFTLPSVSDQPPVNYIPSTLACSTHQPNQHVLHFPAAQANRLFFLLTVQARRTLLDHMDTHIFIKAGPDHGEESTRHLCPMNSFRKFSFFLGSLSFPFCSKLLFRSFPFNFNIVQKFNLCLCFFFYLKSFLFFSFFPSLFLRKKGICRIFFRSRFSTPEIRTFEKFLTPVTATLICKVKPPFWKSCGVVHGRPMRRYRWRLSFSRCHRLSQEKKLKGQSLTVFPFFFFWT